MSMTGAGSGILGILGGIGFDSLFSGVVVAGGRVIGFCGSGGFSGILGISGVSVSGSESGSCGVGSVSSGGATGGGEPGHHPSVLFFPQKSCTRVFVSLILWCQR